MSRKPAPKPADPVLPSEGGAWLRDEDGTLRRADASAPEPPAAPEQKEG